MKAKSRKIKIRIPSWVAVFYIAGSLVTLPWIMYLGETLPTRHLVRHWDLTWVGLDIGLIISLFITGYLASRRSIWMTMASTATGSLLLVDAWFDTTSAHPGKQLWESVAMAVFIEIPLAIISYVLAYRVMHEVSDKCD